MKVSSSGGGGGVGGGGGNGEKETGTFADGVDLQESTCFDYAARRQQCDSCRIAARPRRYEEVAPTGCCTFGHMSGKATNGTEMMHLGHASQMACANMCQYVTYDKL